MTRWTAVSREKHANAHWRPRQGFDFARRLQVIDILIPELSKLLPQFALGFVEQGERFQAVALLGTGTGNLYVNAKGQWLGSYVPAALRGYPFTLARKEDGNAEERVFCIAEDSLVEGKEADSQPLFDGEGRLADTAARTMGFLQQCEQARATTAAATGALAEAGLLRRWPLKVERGDGAEPLTLEALHHIDEERLKEQEPETLAHLLRSGALPLAYAQLLSMPQTQQLTQRAMHLGQEARAGSSGLDLRDLNLFDNNGSLSFDNLDDQ